MQVPGLAVVIVGERKDSQTYVRMKRKACEEVGIASFGADLPESASQAEVLEVCGGGMTCCHIRYEIAGGLGRNIMTDRFINNFI